MTTTSNQWYYFDGNAPQGPCSAGEIFLLESEGKLTGASLLCPAGTDNWRSRDQWQASGYLAHERSSSELDSSPGLWSHVNDKLGRAAGLPKLEGFSLGHLFSEAIRRHSPEEIEAHFIVGTVSTTPRMTDVSTAWPTPWAFLRLMFASLVAAIGFYWAMERFENPLLFPGWLFTGCFALPFSALVFFFEMNALRNVSFYRVATLLFTGGLLAMIISLTLFQYSGLDAVFGAMAAGPIEEAGKLLAVVFFTRKWSKYPWTLNGLLFGAAVGTGFSAFESAGYVFSSLLAGQSYLSETTMILRAFLAPFTHTAWAAATAAALWRVKGANPFQWSMLKDLRFVRIFLIVVALHTAWDAPIAVPILGDWMGYMALRLVFGIVAWVVVFQLAQDGLKQIAQYQQTVPGNSAA